MPITKTIRVKRKKDTTNTMHITTAVDDLDGSTEEVATRRFSLDGEDYEIDLSEENYEALVQELQPFIEKARKPAKDRRAARNSKRNPSANSDRTHEENQAIRAWGRENGWAGIKERGRVPAALVEAYQKANSDLTVAS